MSRALETRHRRVPRRALVALVGTLAWAVTACGGGGDGGETAAPTTGRIGGLVMDPTGAAVAGAEVTTTPETGLAVTDADGAYELTGVPAGTYTVIAVRDGVGAVEKAGVEVTAGGAALVDLTLEGVAAGRIEGTAADVDTGASLADVTLTLTPGDTTTSSDASGVWAFEDVPAGTYRVSAQRDDYAMASATVVVSPDETSEVELTLRSLDASGVLAGVVSGAACDSPVAGATVTTAPPTRDVTTDTDGAWRIDGVAPGTYTVHVTAAGYESAAPETVTVEERETTEWDTCLVALPSYDTTCEGCHLRESALLADLEADPLPEEPGEAGSAGEG